MPDLRCPNEYASFSDGVRVGAVDLLEDALVPLSSYRDWFMTILMTEPSEASIATLSTFMMRFST